jgi:hypothetical protein
MDVPRQLDSRPRLTTDTWLISHPFGNPSIPPPAPKLRRGAYGPAFLHQTSSASLEPAPSKRHNGRIWHSPYELTSQAIRSSATKSTEVIAAGMKWIGGLRRRRKARCLRDKKRFCEGSRGGLGELDRLEGRRGVVMVALWTLCPDILR